MAVAPHHGGCTAHVLPRNHVLLVYIMLIVAHGLLQANMWHDSNLGNMCSRQHVPWISTR